VGSKVYMFGGEDTARRVLGELWVLDLESYTWSQAEVTGTPPAARSAHAATAYGDRYVIIFAGKRGQQHWNCLPQQQQH
jgi:hypothetical protein